MFYLSYLQSVCTRRHWPAPAYEAYSNSQGWFCKVRVNNREYSTDVPYRTETQAREGAATNAYMICRNFSHNDGMYPGKRPGQRSASGAVQGLPVAIGTGRRGSRMTDTSSTYESASSEGTSSGGNSPRSPGSGFEQQMQQVTATMPRAAPTQRASRSQGYVCQCQRAPIYAYERCGLCLREQGWA
ncbi:hypothetical protein LTS14_007441 [Recurvomyces mirabilis]|uniref:uncharacterized protein n=1 Tax=Recurvomyces mirabilis TaxID=574656 RepID=UPI002DDFC841|nr:hypothetical protein LTS14_007441 [Recurvomyces mirabilis]